MLRSSACSPSIPRKLVRWIGRGWTMTSWCVKGSNSTILIFFYMLLSTARYTATPSCFLLFE